MGDWESWPILRDGVYTVTLVVIVDHCCCVPARFVVKGFNVLLPCYNMDIYAALFNNVLVAFNLFFQKM
jgi:hypothetical protein